MSSKPIAVGEKTQVDMATGYHVTITKCLPVYSHATEERKEKSLLVHNESDIARLVTPVLKYRGFDVDMFNDSL